MRPIEQDFLEYRESISHELEIAKNRVRRLIGSAHWLTDGEHKEAVLRKVIRSLSPEMFRIGRGFVCYPRDGTSSGQLDILVASRMRPVLYRDEDILFITASSAEAVVEVKTGLRRGRAFIEVLGKLADELERIRSRSERQKPCWGGLFVYDESRSLDDKYILESLQKITKGRALRAINCISVGTQFFVRFWPKGHPDSSPNPKPMWHSYDLERLAQSYFIGNLILHITPETSIDDELAWFPIPGTKETRKRYYATLRERKAKGF